MREHRDNNQKEPEKPEGDFGSHKLTMTRPEKTASTLRVSEPTRPESQGPFITVTPATPQPKDISQATPSTNGSEHTLTADSPVVMMSPYRINEDDDFPRVAFSKELLTLMDHNKHHLEIDLLRPEGEVNIFPLQDLSPLCLYRGLRILKITGMMQSYQSYIWLVVWLNPQLTDLTLEMAGETEPLDMKVIAEAQKYAECKPTMREVVQGKTKTEVPERFLIVNLSLTNFVVQDAAFQWFSDTLQKVELNRCKDAGLQLPNVLGRSFDVVVTPSSLDSTLQRQKDWIRKSRLERCK